MPETYSTPVKIHRVNTRRRSLQALQCPLEPELLVAEFAGELPPDVAYAVREHIAICSTCGERSRTLRAPYEALASLGNEPVSHVPDLRDAVHHRVHAHGLYKRTLRMLGNLGRGGALGVVSIVGLVVIAAVIAGSVWYTSNVQSAARSSNALANVPAAAASGTLYAESNKLVTVTDGHGHSWQVAEVIAVNEHTGAIVHSLPASSQGLQRADASHLPVGVVVSPDGSTIYEVTAQNSSHRQALVAFDTTSGAVRFALTLTYPDGGALLADNAADALALAPDGNTAYVGLNVKEFGKVNPRVLVVNTQTGAIQGDFWSGINSPIPMPPPPGSLPASAFPNIVPKLDASTYTASVGVHGELAVSADGAWLFDVLALSDEQGQQYAVVQRYNVATGVVEQQLAIPGDFSLAELVAGAAPSAHATQPANGTSGGQASAQPQPQLYLIRSSPDAEVYVLDTSNTGPTLAGTIALGGPVSRPNDVFSGTLSASPSADGTQLYVTQNATTQDGLITGHDLWLVDTQGMSIIAHRLDSDAADAVQSGASASSHVFVLRGGQVLLIAPDLGGSAARWLTLNDGNVIRFLGIDA